MIGVPDPVLGEELKAYVVARDPVTAEELRAFAAARLARFQVPRLWEFRDALPKTATQRVEKYRLRAEHAGAKPPLGWRARSVTLPRVPPLLLLAAALASAAGCAARAPSAPPGCACAGGMVETRLFFGLARPDGRAVSAVEWAAFLADVVTPRFPDGLTVLDGHGQYRLPDRGEVRREETRVVVVVHPDDAASDAALEAIAGEYRRRFAERSVLRVDVPARARF